MLFKFAPKKTVQAAGVLLRAHGGRMSRLRLLKMLYIADRIVLQTIGCTITGDRAYAMANGPVLSRSYDLIKGRDSELPLWGRYIANDGPLNLVLLKQPGVGCLSEFEVDTLQKIVQDFWESDDFAVADFTHQFPEWKKNQPLQGQRKDIPVEDLLEALGMLDLKDRLLAESNSQAAIDDLFCGVDP